MPEQWKPTMSAKWRARWVWVIINLWPVMPMRLKCWAFLNDPDLEELRNGEQ